MKIQLNGKEKEFESPITIHSLVEQLGFGEKRVVVELNEVVVDRETFADTELNESDKVEILRFVGGG